MKRIFSLMLAVLLLVSAVPTAMATTNYTNGTQVVYESTGSESYTITVPAQLVPGGSGTVTLSGTWADNRVVTVTADPTVTLKNSIKETDTKTLNVNFEGGISEAGSNTTSQTFTKDISVDGITDALFGTWSGKFNYNVDVKDTNKNDSPLRLGAKYVRTYLRDGASGTFPKSITAYEDGSFLYVMDSGEEYNIPAGAVTINGNVIDTGDDKESMVISDDGTTVTLSDVESGTVFAIWTLET